MDHILKDIDQNLLQQWGFSFDGSNWSHPNYPFKLTKNSNGYLLVLQDGSTSPHPITTATELLISITQSVPYYLSKVGGNQKFLNKEAEMQRLASLLSDFFNFDPNIKFGMHLDQNGNGALAPGNAYTLTLMSGSEATFKVIHGNKNKAVTDIVYLNPTAMGYHVLKNMFNDDIISVQIQCNDDSWEPFFGIGID